jgi:hypothetical protein
VVPGGVGVVGWLEEGNVTSFITFLSFLLLNYLLLLRASARKLSLCLS